MSTPRSVATPFARILIANRGEVARRIQRTARLMGLQTVAVHSTVDANSLHVREADSAVCIGEPLAYLDIDAIVQAAQLAGAEAVHPGYGFLAENATLARACRDAGLVFIGPTPEAMERMGNKAAAKRLMEQAGLPCVPGYAGQDQGQERLATEAARIGFPVMIKAAAGGGGRGMRLADSADAFSELLHSAKSEARSAFGSDQIILEKALAQPRHIEIQVFADRHGHVIHLGERDCSVQRRHQKLIEEAPSPAIGPELRARMGQLAVQAVQALGYEGAGTLEFLLDAAGHFYFMEMNTRLQVEHPVSECITGLDLVEWQLRVAAGEKLPLTQEQVQYSGHAIEVRLCAEDAEKNFLPQSGPLLHWQCAPHARTEHALEGGMHIAPHYDSMLAKIIVHGGTREEARRKLLHALGGTQLLGLPTNQAFLQHCLAHPAFVAGSVHTGFVAEHLADLLARDEAQDKRACALACALLCSDPQQPPRIPHRLEQERHMALDGRAQDVRVRQQPKNHFTLCIEGQEFAIHIQELAATHARLTCNGLQEPVIFCRNRNELHLHWRGRAWRAQDHTHAAAQDKAQGNSDGTLRASMSGRVVALHAAVGDLVQAGQGLVTLEAMKMEHIHSAPLAGRVAAIHASVGEQVSARRVLLEIAPQEAGQEA